MTKYSPYHKCSFTLPMPGCMTSNVYIVKKMKNGRSKMMIMQFATMMDRNGFPRAGRRNSCVLKATVDDATRSANSHVITTKETDENQRLSGWNRHVFMSWSIYIPSPIAYISSAAQPRQVTHIAGTSNFVIFLKKKPKYTSSWWREIFKHSNVSTSMLVWTTYGIPLKSVYNT